MKHIVQIVQHLAPGGIETLALNLHRHYRDKGLVSSIISLEGRRDEACKRWPVLQEIAGDLLFLDKGEKFSLATVMGLRSCLTRMKAEVVHSHHLGPLLYTVLATTFARSRIRHVHTEHDAWHLENPANRRRQNWMLRLAQPTLVADAVTVAESMTRHLVNDEIVVIPNGIDTRRFVPGDRDAARKSLGLPIDCRLVGCSGRLEKVKGHEVVIRALASLPADVHLAIAGSGSLDAQLKQLAVDLGLEARVHMLGRIDDMPLFYQALECFCLPSFNEGLPLSPLEAQACNVRAVASDVGGTRESICPDTGILVTAGEPAQLARAIDHSLRSQAHAGPREWVLKNGDFLSMANAYERLFAA